VKHAAGIFNLSPPSFDVFVHVDNPSQLEEICDGLKKQDGVEHVSVVYAVGRSRTLRVDMKRWSSLEMLHAVRQYVMNRMID
jgi:hypothetical protein